MAARRAILVTQEYGAAGRSPVLGEFSARRDVFVTLAAERRHVPCPARPAQPAAIALSSAAVKLACWVAALAAVSSKRVPLIR
jgi:hypothetical protein